MLKVNYMVRLVITKNSAGRIINTMTPRKPTSYIVEVDESSMVCAGMSHGVVLDNEMIIRTNGVFTRKKSGFVAKNCTMVIIENV